MRQLGVLVVYTGAHGCVVVLISPDNLVFEPQSTSDLLGKSVDDGFQNPYAPLP